MEPKTETFLERYGDLLEKISMAVDGEPYEATLTVFFFLMNIMQKEMKIPDEKLFESYKAVRDELNKKEGKTWGLFKDNDIEVR